MAGERRSPCRLRPDNAFLTSLRTGVITLAVAVWLAGCSLAPRYQRPEVSLPVWWTDGNLRPDTWRAQGTISHSMDWTAFVTDDTLAEIVRLALAHNRDLRQALLNVEAARAGYRIERASQSPHLQADATGTRQRTPAEPGVQAEYEAGLGLAAFELDLFGRLRSLSQAALHEYLATREAADGARVSLIAEVIQAYLIRDGAQHRYLIGTQVLQAREAALRLVVRQQERGLASKLDHLDALGLVAQAKADLERIDRQFRQAGNALLLLVGTPDVIARLPDLPSTHALLAQGLAADTPSGLLARRPDIRAAEHRLQARNADIGAARAAFFPRISLTGRLGTRSAELSDLFNGGTRTWSFSPQITLPILDAGANRANLDRAHIRKDAAIAAYELAVQTAFRDVSDALAAIDTLRREEDARRAAARAGEQALRLSELRHRSGVDDGLRYLDAQRGDYANQMAVIEIETERQLALVALFRSLGGTWQASGPG